MNELYLYGSVGDSFWGEECFTPSTVRDQLAQMSGPITVRINSGGGVAPDGQTIYNLLRDYDGEKTVIIDGIAASAASLIAMAGDRVVMRQGSILMIHDPAFDYMDERGTEDAHLRAAQRLRVVATSYAGVYAKAAGISVDTARAIMKAETYYEGQAAIDAGFVTEFEDEAAAVPAAFDYSVYARAPKRLLKTGAHLAPHARSRMAAVAMIMGVQPLNRGKDKMAKIKAALPGDDEIDLEGEDTLTGGDDTIAGGDEPEMEGEDTLEGGADDVDPEEEEDAPKPAAKAKVKASLAQVLDICAAMDRPASEARDMISRGLSLKQALAEVTAKTAKDTPVTANIRPGAPRARITRDERETRRLGMEGALVAKMARDRTVTGPARDFMDMSLGQMAASAVGKPAPYEAAGKLRVLEMALGSQSTSDFPAVFENALNKRLLAAYQVAEPTYRRLSTRMDFTDFRPHPIAGIGDLAPLLPVGETGEIKSGSTGDKKEMVALVAYGRQFQISRQMMVNDDLGAIDRLLATRGRMVAATEEALFYQMLLSGANADGPTLLETGRQLFNPTDVTKAAAAAAITPASLDKGRAAMLKKKGIAAKAEDALDLEINPSIILVGPDKLFEAQQLLETIQATQASNVNPFSGKLEIVVSAKITGNAWYLFADPGIAPVLMYGYLLGEEGPRMRMHEPFGTQGVAYSVELDFGIGAIDHRGGYKNAGA